jgi:uncharacterized damage-inducible protein DinB
MFLKISDFSKEWVTESAATAKIMGVLTDASLNQKVTPEGRSLGRLAWHIVLSLGEMGGRTGAVVDAPMEDALVPESAQIIAEAYETAACSLAASVQDGWKDAMLTEMVDMYGEQWSRSASLYILIKHEIHHRAQMTVLMRQAGIKVPGVYGPSREEWAAYGALAAE